LTESKLSEVILSAGIFLPNSFSINVCNNTKEEESIIPLKMSFVPDSILISGFSRISF
jgi:hypothetical protein